MKLQILLSIGLIYSTLFGSQGKQSEVKQVLKNHFEIRLIEIENDLEKKVTVFNEADELMTHVLPGQTLPFNYVLSQENIIQSRNIQNGRVEAKFSNIATLREIRVEIEPFFKDAVKQPATVLLLRSDVKFDQYTGKIKAEIAVIDYHSKALLVEKIKYYDAFKDHLLNLKLEVEKSKSKTYPIAVDLDLED